MKKSDILYSIEEVLSGVYAYLTASIIFTSIQIIDNYHNTENITKMEINTQQILTSSSTLAIALIIIIEALTFLLNTTSHYQKNHQ